MFFLCQPAASSTENKQNTSAGVNIVTAARDVSFSATQGDRGWRFKRPVVVILIFAGAPAQSQK